MDIHQFMKGYKAAWEQRDESMFCALFASDGEYETGTYGVGLSIKYSF